MVTLFVEFRTFWSARPLSQKKKRLVKSWINYISCLVKMFEQVLQLLWTNKQELKIKKIKMKLDRAKLKKRCDVRRNQVFTWAVWNPYNHHHRSLFFITTCMLSFFLFLPKLIHLCLSRASHRFIYIYTHTIFKIHIYTHSYIARW